MAPVPRLFFLHLLLLLQQLRLSTSAVSGRAACEELGRLQSYEEKIYSQNGEDGVLVALLGVVGVKTKYYVEFGVADGVECNSRILREHFGFDGLMMDGGHEDVATNLRQEVITEANVLSLFAKYDVPQTFDLLSLDVDMFDYWILARLLGPKGNYRPRIIIVETNPSLCLNKAVTMRDYSRINAVPMTVVHPTTTNQTTWDLSRYAGANPAAFQRLGRAFGYEMVYCERCGVNCFMVLKSELPVECQHEYPMPMVPYPCFGTLRTAGQYPGHEYDPLTRPTVRVTDTLLSKLVTSGEDVTAADLEGTSVACDAEVTTTSWLIELLRERIRASEASAAAAGEAAPDPSVAAAAAAAASTPLPPLAPHEVEVTISVRFEGGADAPTQAEAIRASLCDDRAVLTERSRAFCQRYVPAAPNDADAAGLEACLKLVGDALVGEVAKRADEVPTLCPPPKP